MRASSNFRILWIPAAVVLRQVGQAVLIRVKVSIGNARVQAVCRFPGIWHSVAIGVSYHLGQGQLEARREAESKMGVRDKRVSSGVVLRQIAAAISVRIIVGIVDAHSEADGHLPIILHPIRIGICVRVRKIK